MIRVLVVDDHEIVRDALSALIRDASGMTVADAASSISEVVRILDDDNPDVVLADESLGNGRATEFVRAVRLSRPEARVVIISGSIDARAAAALAGGAAGYVLKSQSSAALLEAIRVVAIGGPYVAPEVAAMLSTASARKKKAIRAEPGGELEALSQREQEIFHLVVEGHATKEIARHLFISPKTVESHRTKINRKLAVKTAADLVRFAVAHGIRVAPRPLAELPAAKPNSLH
jgi:DNA-binding NarL/FixJ family response regulator